MQKFASIVFVLFSLASADFLWFHTDRDCRQCTGSQTIVFNEPTSNSDALLFFQKSLGLCGNLYEYITIAIKKNGCFIRGSLEVCTRYEYVLRFWRYCGKGNSVNVNRGARCLNGICAKSDIRTLTCTKQVQCQYLCQDDCGWYL